MFFLYFFKYKFKLKNNILNSFQVEIRTKDETLYQGSAKQVQLKSMDGCIGITTNTTHLLGVLLPCNISIVTDSENAPSYSFVCFSGFYLKCDTLLKIILQ
ncbi:MAG: hypothetical protein C0432_01850 [Candidatus Puniceispirillum sp.]|nr:hypothetical protein [Candidatus Pelagibacter sp.]MBA4283019.1 hypothetical protein [Candidatus Puniceispirillum sp.]